MKIHRAKTKPEEARRDVNVKHHHGTLQIEPTGFRCRVLEIRVSLASTFTIFLHPVAADVLVALFPSQQLGSRVCTETLLRSWVTIYTPDLERPTFSKFLPLFARGVFNFSYLLSIYVFFSTTANTFEFVDAK